MNEAIFFTDLDTILDTRMSTLYNMDNMAAVRLVPNGYHSRKKDVFDGFIHSEYLTAYEYRGEDILKNAIMTKVLNIIMDFTYTTRATNSSDYRPKLLVNIYPYTLSEEDGELLLKAVVIKTNNHIEIEFVNMSYEEITPTWVNEKITMMCIYDYRIWLETHSENKNFDNCLCSEITLLAPKVIFSEDDLEVDYDDAFVDMEKFISPFIAIKFLPIDDFSLIINPT